MDADIVAWLEKALAPATVKFDLANPGLDDHPRVVARVVRPSDGEMVRTAVIGGRDWRNWDPGNQVRFIRSAAIELREWMEEMGVEPAPWVDPPHPA